MAETRPFRATEPDAREIASHGVIDPRRIDLRPRAARRLGSRRMWWCGGGDGADLSSRMVEMNELPIKLMNVPKMPMPTTIVTIAMIRPPVVTG